jgi:hypothetical protein
MMRIRYLLLAALGPLAAMLPAVAGEVDHLDDRAGRVAMAGSYLGMSDFCPAHGVDFREIAHPLIEKMSQKAYWAKVNPERSDYLTLVFGQAVKAGGRGELYSVEMARYIVMTEMHSDMRRICEEARRQAATIGGLRDA